MDETRIGVKVQLEIWQYTLESKGFRLCWNKTKYMKCKFSTSKNRDGVVRLYSQVITKSKRFDTLDQ